MSIEDIKERINAMSPDEKGALAIDGGFGTGFSHSLIRSALIRQVAMKTCIYQLENL